ncbi:MAG TPA: GntR family transcriptional regulator [Streptosporangiaceae bacterium]|nr:GntR family transcriptional regulator [Streptosporangiaceae bacterium]
MRYTLRAHMSPPPARQAQPARPRAPRSPLLTAAAAAPPSRTVAVLEAIKHAILSGELQPGRPLVETDLAEVLGVSKTPVREALKTLAGAGLVTMSPYKGAVVRVVDDEQARHIYDVRLLLEPEALGRAVAMRQAGPGAAGDGERPVARQAGGGWQAARAALARADAAADQAERSLANRDFHRELYAGCGNPLLVSMLDDLRDQTALVSAAAWRHDPHWLGTPSWEREAAEHRAVLDAAEAGDAAAAVDLLRAHISSFVARNFPEKP